MARRAAACTARPASRGSGLPDHAGRGLALHRPGPDRQGGARRRPRARRAAHGRGHRAVPVRARGMAPAGVRQRPVPAGAVPAWPACRPGTRVGSLADAPGRGAGPGRRHARPAGRAARRRRAGRPEHRGVRRRYACRPPGRRRARHAGPCALPHRRARGAAAPCIRATWSCWAPTPWPRSWRASWRWPRASPSPTRSPRSAWPPAHGSTTARSSGRARRPFTWPRSKCGRSGTATSTPSPSRKGAALSRTNIYTTLAGPGAHATLYGLYLGEGRQHVDHQTRIEHAAPNCTSWEVYKGILDGHAHGVFNGKVYVHPEAQKTDGKQTNKNLLLSDTAKVDTKPQLEIFADDVKCTHGATVGQPRRRAALLLPEPRDSRGRGPHPPHLRLRGGRAGGNPEPPGGGSSRGPDAGVAVEGGAAGQRVSGAGDGLIDVDRQHCPPAPRPRRRRWTSQRHPPPTSRSWAPGSDGKPLVYLDNAATSQKPLVVIEAVRRFLAEENANVHRGRPLPERTGHAGVRRGAGRGARLPERAGRARGHLRPRHHRGDQPRGPELRADDAPPRRRNPPHHDGAPQQHRPLAAGGRADRCRGPGHPDHRRGRGGPRRLPQDAGPADPHRRRRAHLQRPRHHQSGRGDDPPGARGRARSCWWTAPRRRPHMPSRRAGARLRLLRLLGPQDVRADRGGSPLGPDRAARTRCRPGRAAAT